MPELAVGHLALAQKRYAEAEQLSGGVLAFLIERDFVMFQPEFYYLQGLALAKRGQDAAAREVLYQGLNVLRQTNGRLWHLEIVSLLIELEGNVGGETAVLRQEARATYEIIIEHIPEQIGPILKIGPISDSVRQKND